MNRKVVLFLLTLLILPSCIPHRENHAYTQSFSKMSVHNDLIKGIAVDSLFFDASQTSLSGQWLLVDSIFYYVDKYIIGVKKYDLDGNFIEEKIKEGRGPDEMICPIWISAFDKELDAFVFQDSNCCFHIYDKNFNRIYSTQAAWFTLLDEGYGAADWDYLLRKPNPNCPQMYEYNFESERMYSSGGEVTLPVITEHVSYNGYYINAHSKHFWRESATFMSVNIRNISNTRHFFGWYPPVYQKGNIPIFSTYDFCVVGDNIVVSFAADPNLYVMSEDGIILYSFGFPSDNIKCKYPSTTTFEEYENKFDSQRDEYGYYGRLFYDGTFLFRQYRTDQSEWRMQIYEDEILIGDFQIAGNMEIIGEKDGFYYAYSDVDYETDEFIIIRFSLVNE